MGGRYVVLPPEYSCQRIAVSAYTPVAFFTENGGQYKSFFLGLTSTKFNQCCESRNGSAQYTGFVQYPSTAGFP